MTDSMTEIKPTLFTDHFVTTQPGEPYRLLPFGKIGRPGLEKTITPDFARQFKLPHFKPPIKLGSHNDETPAGGHILRLEVREDGLYAIPEMNESGTSSMVRGDFRYHSPEIIWEDEGIFDAQGEFIPGPLILGDALLHTPHLGEAAALYGLQMYKIESTNHKEVILEEKKQDTGLIERILGGKLEAEVTELRAVKETLSETVTELTAAKSDLEAQVTQLATELEQATAKLEAIEAEQVQADKEAALREKLGEIELDEDTVTFLTGLEPEQQDKLIVKFKALNEQAKVGDIENEIGSEGGGIDDPVTAFDIAVKRKAEESQVSYIEAIAIVSNEKPDLAKAYNEILGGK